MFSMPRGPGLGQVAAELLDRRADARQVRGDPHAEPLPDLLGDVERLVARRAAGAVGAGDDVRGETPSAASTLSYMASSARGRLGREELERERETAGGVEHCGVRNSDWRSAECGVLEKLS